MADVTGCALINSYTIGCDFGIGGIKELKIKVLPSNATIASNYAVTSGAVVVSGGSLTGWYTYQLVKGTCYLKDNEKKDLKNGTLFWTPEVYLNLNKLTAAKRNEFLVLGRSTVQIAVRDANDTYWMAGANNGLDMLAGESGTGTDPADKNGYSLTFTGQESVPIYNMTQANYDLLVTA